MQRILHLEPSSSLQGVIPKDDAIDLVVVENTEDAKRELKSGHFDLILTDGDFDGAIDFLKELRQDGEGTPACVLVSMNPAEFKAAVNAKGGFNCLTHLPKSLTLEELHARLLDALAVVSEPGVKLLDAIEDRATRVQKIIREQEESLESQSAL